MRVFCRLECLQNRADWLADKNWIDLLREVGPCFSVNRMLTMDSVKGRMESGGVGHRGSGGRRAAHE